MSVAFQAVQWNRQKKIYDGLLIAGVAIYLGFFCLVTLLLFPYVTAEIMLIKAFGTAAIILLHLILCIGPLCRLNPIFLPLLYNRRHMGVTCFILGFTHAIIVVLTYHFGAEINPIASIFVSDAGSGMSGFPFQPLGFIALVILFLMAATSHDFWLSQLSAPVWKTLHTLVYFAYGLLILHVVFGILQTELNPFYTILVGIGVLTVLSLHLIAGYRERSVDMPIENIKTAKIDAEGFIDVCAVDEITENEAEIYSLTGERVAVFKYDNKISAVSNVCQHQNGPLGEGKFIDGCITCPWHGYQYMPDSGASPPPFSEKIPTFRVKVERDRVWIHPQPNAPGTHVEPAPVL